MAPLGVRLHVVVDVERGRERRIISARKANGREVDASRRRAADGKRASALR
jgi:uncharacterized DUF497 family protein